MAKSCSCPLWSGWLLEIVAHDVAEEEDWL